MLKTNNADLPVSAGVGVMSWICKGKGCKEINRDDSLFCSRCKEDRFEKMVEDRVHNATDFALIDAAAKAWIEAGGDADGVTFCWHHIRDRVGELS